jgi:hypothetical protein
LSALGIIACVVLLTSWAARAQTIAFLERHIYHRKANYSDDRMEDLRFFARVGIFSILVFDLWSVTPVFAKIKQALKDCLLRIDFRPMVKPILLMTGIYGMALTALFRANFYYNDDLGRTVEGYIGMLGLSRYVSQIIGLIMHADFNINDISPLPQLFAVLFVATASVLLVYILNHGKITISGLIASMPIGLSPYFLSCLSFKYDSPYMALSVLASIVPFLFIENRRAFIASSVLALWVMCMSYQASSGIYMMLAFMIACRDWNDGQKRCRETGVFIGTAAVSFCAALIAFRIFLMNPGGGRYGDYIGIVMFSPSKMLPGIFGNLSYYVSWINSDFALSWKACIAFICVLFTILIIKQSVHNKLIAVAVSIMALFAIFAVSFGAYLMLEKPLYSPRGMYGFGVFIALVAVSIASKKHKINMAAVIALNWCFTIFAFTYGNALADQKRYADFRTEILLNDLTQIFPQGATEDMTIQLQGSAGFSPSVQHISEHYPVITRLVPVPLSGPKDTWGIAYLLWYFNWGTEKMLNYRSMTNNDVNPGKETGFIDGDFMSFDLPTVLDTSYHAVKTDGKHILVLLK